MNVIRFKPPYEERALKAWVRRHFATQTARLGLPESRHEDMRRRMFQIVAALTLLAYAATGTLIYFFALIFWCGWMVLIGFASKWQSAKLRAVAGSEDEFDAEFLREFGDK